MLIKYLQYNLVYLLLGVENLSLSRYNVTPIEKYHGGIAATYDAQLGLSRLAPSPNGPSIVGWYLYIETLSQVLAFPMF